MSDHSELSRLFAAERAETRSASAAEQGLAALRDALSAGIPPLPVGHGPLPGFGATVAVKTAVVSGVVALGITASGLALLAKPPVTAPQAGAVTSTTAGRATAPAPLVAPLAAPLPSLSVAPLPKPVPRAASAEPEPPSTFAEELRLIKAAKQDVDAGRNSLARARLDEHARLYPQGVFRNEREALRLRAAAAEPSRSTPGAAPAPVPTVNFPDAGNDK